MHSLEDLRAGRLNGARQLRLCAGLGEFPREIFDLADTLEMLDLSGNQLARCRTICRVCTGCASCSARGIPSGCCPRCWGAARNWRWWASSRARLNGCRPRLAATPSALADPHRQPGRGAAGLHRALHPAAETDAGRQPPAQPAAGAGRVHRLELLRIAANQLTGLPGWLLRLPRLAWLAYAGNPFCAAVEQAAQGADRVPIRCPGMPWPCSRCWGRAPPG
jgi:hypothetical protein